MRFLLGDQDGKTASKDSVSKIKNNFGTEIERGADRDKRGDVWLHRCSNSKARSWQYYG